MRDHLPSVGTSDMVVCLCSCILIGILLSSRAELLYFYYTNFCYTNSIGFSWNLLTFTVVNLSRLVVEVSSSKN